MQNPKKTSSNNRYHKVSWVKEPASFVISVVAQQRVKGGFRKSFIWMEILAGLKTVEWYMCKYQFKLLCRVIKFEHFLLLDERVNIVELYFRGRILHLKEFLRLRQSAAYDKPSNVTFKFSFLIARLCAEYTSLLFLVVRLVPIVLVKCWKVGRWNALKLL